MAAVVDRARSCVVVRDREWSCVVVRGGRACSCVVERGHARRSWSCAAAVRGPSCVVVRGRAWSYVVVRGRAWSSLTAVLPASRPALPCCPLRGQRCRVGPVIFRFKKSNFPFQKMLNSVSIPFQYWQRWIRWNHNISKESAVNGPSKWHN